MRVATAALSALLLCGGAIAQTAPTVTIEDDVSRDNAIKCVAVRTAQMKAHSDRSTTPDPLLRATLAAWTKYVQSQPGFDAARVDADIQATMRAWATAAGYAENRGQFMSSMADACKAFEIRTPH
jgi:hypothetical protein